MQSIRTHHFALVLALASPTAYSQHTFQRKIGNGPEERFTAVVQTSDGGYAASGATTAFRASTLSKLNSFGLLEWEWIIDAGNLTIATSVRQTVNGGYILSGETTDDPTHQIALIRTDPLGVVQWAQAYKGQFQDHAHGTHVRECAGGGFVVAGGGSKLARTDVDGNLLWENSYTLFSYTLRFRDVRQNPDGGFTVVGSGTPISGGNASSFLMRTDVSGAVLWARKYLHTGGAQRQALDELASGGYVLSGELSPGGRFLLRTDSLGQPLWERHYSNLGGGGDQYGAKPAVHETITGELLLNGNSGLQAALAWTSAAGTLLGSMRYGGAGSVSWDVAPTAEGGFMTVGTNGGFGYLVKTDSHGLSGCQEESIDPGESSHVPSSADVTSQVFSVTDSGQVSLAYNQSTLQRSNVAPCGQRACTPAPRDMVMWLTLDEQSGPVANNAVGGNDGDHVSLPTPVLGKVGYGLQLDGLDQYVQVAPYPALDVGAGDLSIDAWIKWNTAGDGTLVCKRQDEATSTTGYTLYLRNGFLGFQLADGPGLTNFEATSTPVPADGTWHHVAVAVDRAPAPFTYLLPEGRLYLDGVVILSFDPTVRPGSLDSPIELRVGSLSDDTTSLPFDDFAGCIDEVELFRRALRDDEVLAIFDASSAGKCKELCVLPWDRPFCQNETSIIVSAQICNATPTAQTYDYSFQGLPIGHGCSIAGPTSFSFPPGPITVPAGECASIPVTIARPAGMNAWKQVACYQMVIENTSSGVIHSCRGSVQDRGDWCAVSGFDWASLLFGQPAMLGPVQVTNSASATGQLVYRVVAIDDSMQPDDGAVSLNGLPPGVPVTGTLQVPQGSTGDIPVSAEYVSYQPGRFYTLLIETDDDADGAYEPLLSIGVRNEMPATTDALGTSYCVAVPNSTGAGALMSASGSASVSANDLVLRCDSVPAGQFGIFYYGPNQLALPFGNGIRCVGGQAFRLGVQAADAGGVLERVIDLSAPPEPAGTVNPGSTWNYQAWFRDPAGGGASFNLSDGLQISFQP